MSWLFGQRWNEIERMVYEAVKSQNWLTDNYRFKIDGAQSYYFTRLSNNFGDKVVRIPTLLDGDIEIMEFYDDWHIQPILNAVNVTTKQTGIVDQLDTAFAGAIPSRFYNIWAGLSRTYDTNNKLIPYIFLTAQHLASINMTSIPHNTAGQWVTLTAGNRNNKYQFTVGSEAFIWSTTNNTFNTCTITDIWTGTHAANPRIQVDTHNEFYSQTVTGTVNNIYIVQINNQMPYVVPETLASVADRQTYPESVSNEKYNCYALIDSFMQGDSSQDFEIITDMGAGFKRLAFAKEIYNDSSPISVPIYLPTVVPINAYRTRFETTSTITGEGDGFNVSVDCPGSALDEILIYHNIHARDHQFGKTVEKPYMDCLPILRITAPDQDIVMNMKGFYSGKPFFESILPTEV